MLQIRSIRWGGSVTAGIIDAWIALDGEYRDLLMVYIESALSESRLLSIGLEPFICAIAANA